MCSRDAQARFILKREVVCGCRWKERERGGGYLDSIRSYWDCKSRRGVRERTKERGFRELFTLSEEVAGKFGKMRLGLFQVASGWDCGEKR